MLTSTSIFGEHLIANKPSKPEGHMGAELVSTSSPRPFMPSEILGGYKILGVVGWAGVRIMVWNGRRSG